MEWIEDISISGLVFAKFHLVTTAELLVDELSNERVLSQLEVIRKRADSVFWLTEDTQWWRHTTSEYFCIQELYRIFDPQGVSNSVLTPCDYQISRG